MVLFFRIISKEIDNSDKHWNNANKNIFKRNNTNLNNKSIDTTEDIKTENI